MSNFRFEEPWLLLLLLTLPVLAILRGRLGRPAAVRFSTLGLLTGLGKARHSRAGGFLFFGRLLAVALLIFGLARPQFGTERTTIEASGVDIMLAIDISGSMWAHDFTMGGKNVDRLTAVKKVVEDFIGERPNDRIGLVAFSGEPYLVSPLTLNHFWVRENLERLRIGMVENGTAIGSALALCTNSLRDLEAETRIVVLLTDGENNSGKIEPAAAAEAAAAFNIKIYAVGVGQEGLVKMPRLDPNGNPYRNSRGDLIFTRTMGDLDEETLQTVADKTGAQFFRATDTEALESVYREIDTLEKTEVEMDVSVNYREAFQWFALPALGLIALEQLLGLTRFRRLP